MFWLIASCVKAAANTNKAIRNLRGIRNFIGRSFLGNLAPNPER